MEKNLSKLSKKELIEIIRNYKEKLSIVKEYSEVLRVNSM